MALFTDDFNRADSTDLGAGWVEVSGDWSIVSNRLSPGTSSGTIIVRAAVAMESDDHYAQVTIAATTTASQGVWCRGNSSFTNGYLWRNDGTSWDLFSVASSTFTVIGSYVAAAAPGDVARVRAVGSTITGYVNGVERVSVTNTAVATGTSVGIRSDSVAAVRYDNFSAAETITTGSATASFGGLTAAATGVQTVPGTAAGQFGALTAAATGTVESDDLELLDEGSVVSGSWEQLLSIKAEAIAYVREARTNRPVACPIDGEPLDAAANGVLHCKWGNYQWPRDRHFI